jgi:hypothetical protein
MSKYKGRIQEDTDLVNKKYVDDMMKAAKLAAYPIGSVIYWDVPPHYTNTDEPSSPVVNDIWCDISAGLPGVYKIYNGTTWDAYDFPDLSTADKVAAYFGGGTWVQITDKFILAAGETYTAGNTGGSADAIVVSHNHIQNSHNHTQDAHFHKLSYTVVNRASGSAGVRNVYGGGVQSDELASTSTTATNNATTATNQSAGEDGTGKNMPPYRTLYCWQRLK